MSNDVPIESQTANAVTGVILVESSNSEDMRNSLSQYGIVDIDMLEVETVVNESALFRHIVLLVTTWNPDILLGYEVTFFNMTFIRHFYT